AAPVRRRDGDAGVKAPALALTAAIALAACSTAEDGREAVVLWHSYAGEERAALEEVATAVNERSTELRLVLVSVPHEALADKLTNAIPNGNGPDLFIYPGHDRIGDWVAGGLIEPIEYYVSEATADRFAADAIAAMAYQGSLYGLPLAVKSVALYYRTDRVARPPATTDELVALGRRLTSDGRFALVYDNTKLYGHAAWLHGFGSRVFDERGQLALDTPEAIAAARFAREIGGAGGIVPPGMTGTLVSTLFNEGKAAMAISGPWLQAELEADVPWKVASLPTVSATGRPAAPFLGAEGIFLSSRARDMDAAFALMDELAGDDSALRRARRGRQVVPNRAAYREPDIGGDPVLAAFQAQAEASVPMPATPAMRMVWTPYETALQKIIGQGADPAATLAAAEREIAGYLEGAGQ
ncbi:MAG TPA: extracellular solute-binding protein, partial [Kofleriaceae bacterium]|nr:extracellular solute-binding protein [Kofleriaceae bacterium]